MIVILDLGSHENTVVARAIRALGVYSEIYPHDITAEELKALPGVKGVIINGGPNNVIDGEAIDVCPEIYEVGLPIIAAGHDKAKCAIPCSRRSSRRLIQRALRLLNSFRQTLRRQDVRGRSESLMTCSR